MPLRIWCANLLFRKTQVSSSGFICFRIGQWNSFLLRCFSGWLLKWWDNLLTWCSASSWCSFFLPGEQGWYIARMRRMVALFTCKINIFTQKQRMYIYLLELSHFYKISDWCRFSENKLILHSVKQFGSRSDPTKCWTWFGSILIQN